MTRLNLGFKLNKKVLDSRYILDHFLFDKVNEIFHGIKI